MEALARAAAGDPLRRRERASGVCGGKAVLRVSSLRHSRVRLGFMSQTMFETAQSLLSWLPENLRETLFVRLFGLTQVPLIGYIRPRILEISDERVRVLVPLNRRNKNHLRAMYFGVLSAGADVAGGLIAMRLITRRKAPVQLVFKDFQAEFLKRAEGDVVFTCTEGREIAALVDRVIASGERENLPVHVVATVPSKLADEPVARFILTLSLKRKG